MDTDCHERSDFNIALRTVTALRIFTRIFVLHDLRVPRITVNHGCRLTCLALTLEENLAPNYQLQDVHHVRLRYSGQ